MRRVQSWLQAVEQASRRWRGRPKFDFHTDSDDSEPAEKVRCGDRGTGEPGTGGGCTLAFSSTFTSLLSGSKSCNESSGTKPKAKGQTLTASCYGPNTLINSPDSCLNFNIILRPSW